MNILFVVPYVPNLVRTRPYNLIRHLTQQGHRVTVLTLWTSDEERRDVELLKRECHEVQAMSMPAWRSFWNCLRILPGGAPLQSAFSWRPELVRLLNGTTKFDVAHVEHLRGSRYGLYLKRHLNVPVIWDSVDCISHLFRQAAVRSKSLVGRWRTRFELNRTEAFEGWLLDKFDHVLVTSQSDKEALASLRRNGADPSPISVLENGVDLSYFTPDFTVAREPATLILSGKMSYHANETMAVNLMQNIMPLVWRVRPDVKLWIVGKDPTRQIRAFAEHPAVTVTGYVEDLRPYFHRATLAVAPLAYGAGIQNKVLEAMACATPVVTTPQAVSALSVTQNRDLLVAEEPRDFSEAVVSLLNDSNKHRQFGHAGLSYVREHHDWGNVARRLGDIYLYTSHNDMVPHNQFASPVPVNLGS